MDQIDDLASELSTLVRLGELTDRLWRSHELQTGLEEIIDAGMAQLGADMGNIQLLNPEKHVLEIVAHRGFGADFLRHFSEVSAADDSACGRSLRTGERIVIQDVEVDAAFAPHFAAAAAAGFRAVQSTPLFGTNAKPLGVFSTHFRRPHRPSERDLRWFDLYAYRAAQFIQRITDEERLRRLSRGLLQAQETGNQELARELHDVFSQELAAVAMELSALWSAPKVTGRLGKRLQELSKRTGQLADRMQETSRRLHPSILHDLGLEAALRRECDKFSEEAGIPVQFTCQELPTPLEDVSLCLYRVAQESLFNIRKHAGASKALVRLQVERGGISLRVEDTGEGFNVDEARRSGGLGLVGIEERVHLLNGEFNLRSQPGQGTIVEVFLPVG